MGNERAPWIAAPVMVGQEGTGVLLEELGGGEQGWPLPGPSPEAFRQSQA